MSSDRRWCGPSWSWRDRRHWICARAGRSDGPHASPDPPSDESSGVATGATPHAPVADPLIVPDEQLPFSTSPLLPGPGSPHVDVDRSGAGRVPTIGVGAPAAATPGDVAGTDDDATNSHSEPVETGSAEYASRLALETARFASELEVHDLPAIFHYWSNRYLRPKLEFFGAGGPDDYFADQLQRALADAPDRPARFISIGAGNGDTEVRVATILKDRGVDDFILECLEITDEMRDRCRELAAGAGVEHLVQSIWGDFNSWVPDRVYDGVLANQSLHHVVNLEGLFDAVAASLRPSGRFVTSDMIGRNGHQRWPEALAIVQQFWTELPDAYRYNRQLRRHEEVFQDWDCSAEGFEGIRAQDVLALLVQRFDFEDFLAFGNVIDPFIDRGFGPHFDAESTSDRDFIDRVHASDEAAIEAGTLTPTHLIATMRLPGHCGPRRWWGGLTPTSCVRPPS